MRKKLLSTVRVTVAVLLAVFASNAVTLASVYADTSDSYTPYTVSAEQLKLPVGTTFEANGHINYEVTKLDGTGSMQFNVHNAQPGNGVWPNEQLIGASSYDFQSHPNFPAAYKTNGYCIKWVQVSLYNQHFGEGGQSPACTTPSVDEGETKKVAYCHATGSESNPYVSIETSVNAFYQSGHNEHEDDIVPPFTYEKHGETISFPGLNWDAAHQAIFNDGCKKAEIPTTCVDEIKKSDVNAHYTTDDFHAVATYTGPTNLCDGVSVTISLNSYSAEGPTWPTSGNQELVEHSQVTLSATNLSGNLEVEAPSCYYQTDLYWGDTKYDGVDGALPHYPDSTTPEHLIAARNGGSACTEPPKEVTPVGVTPIYPTCANPTQAGFSVQATTGVVYKVTVNGTTNVAANGFNAATVGTTVTVTAEAEDDTYVLKAGTQLSWEFSFAAATDCVTDVCPNITGVQTSVPTGYVVDADDGNCYEVGGRGGDTPITTAQVLGITGPTITHATVKTNVPQLANTGNNTILVMVLSFAIITMAVGASFGVRQTKPAL